MRSTLLVSLVASTLALGVTAYAHHSFPATYQVNKTIQLEGKVTQFLLRNPHSFLQIDAADGAGKMLRWSLEWGGANQLTNQGVLKDTLKVGDDIIVTANPARSSEDSTRALLKSIRRPADGWSWGNQPGQTFD